MTGKLITHKTDEEIARAWYQAALRLAILAAIISIFGSIMLGQAWIQRKNNDPFRNKQITGMVTQLSKEQDPAKKDILIEKIRRKDVEVNREFRKADSFIHSGIYLLLGCLVVFVFGARVAVHYREKLPAPQHKSRDNIWISAGVSRRAVIMLGVLLFGVACIIVAKSPGDPFAGLALVASGKMAMPMKGSPASSATVTAALPGSATIGSATSSATVFVDRWLPALEVPGLATSSNGVALHNWPAFRGPLGTGITFEATPPFSWNGATGENILWKVPVDLPGMCSPIVWGDKVFLAGATEDKREVYCYNGTTGALLWKKEVSAGENEPKEKPSVFADTGFAAPTMATDGNLVYAIFANGDIAGFDLDGNQKWVKNHWGIPSSYYGYSSSLLPYRNRLIVQMDHDLIDKSGVDIPRNISCLDGSTGAIIWSTARPPDAGNTWSSPILINTGTREEIITAGRPYAISYDPLTGAELWRANCLGGDVGPSPIYAGGLVFVAEESEKLSAIRPGGSGDVTKDIVWQAEDDMPNTISPVSNGDLLFVTSGEGKISCYDVATGKQYWQHTFGNASAYASPVLVGNSIFYTNHDGNTYIFPAERTFNEDQVRINVIKDTIDASMAVVGRRIYLRGKDSLYCIGAKP